MGSKTPRYRTLFLFGVLVGDAAFFGSQSRLSAATADDWGPVELKQDMWRFVDVDGDCRGTWKGDKLVLEVPGSIHDLVGDGYRNAPRMLMNRDGDFALSVRVGGRLAPGRPESERFAPYHGAGIVVWAGEGCFVRLERAKIVQPGGSEVTYINFEEQGISGGRPINQIPVREDAPLYLRVERRGNQVASSISLDAKAWKSLGDSRLKPGKMVSVGFAAVNNTDAPFSPEFSELKFYGAKGR